MPVVGAFLMALKDMLMKEVKKQAKGSKRHGHKKSGKDKVTNEIEKKARKELKKRFKI